MPEVVDLLALQREFLAALREPLLGEGRAATALPPRAGEPSRQFTAVAEEYLTASRAPDSQVPLQPVERLELYHRQYWYRVLDSLEEDFPALKSMLGDRRFRTLLEDYLETTPSRSCTLRHLGSRLPAFLASRPHAVGRHAAAAVELAQLEYALCLAFEAEEVAPADAGQLERGRVRLQAHVQLFALRTAADETWRHAVRGEGVDCPPSAAAVGGRFVVVFRDGFVPSMETVEPEAFRLLSSLHHGATLAEAIDSCGLAAAPPGDLGEAGACAIEAAEAAARDRVADAAVRLQRWFSQWTSRGWLIAAS